LVAISPTADQLAVAEDVAGRAKGRLAVVAHARAQERGGRQRRCAW